MTRPREFWIIDKFGGPQHIVYYKPRQDIESWTHVIEKSAYDKAISTLKQSYKMYGFGGDTLKALGEKTFIKAEDC